MDAQLVEPAISPEIDFDVIDLDALQAYLALYVQNLHNLSRVTQACFGALGACDADFHIRGQVSDVGAVSFVQREALDQRVSLVIDTARARLDSQHLARDSLNLVLFRVESTDDSGAHLALISLGRQPPGTVHSYQILEVSSQTAFAEILAGPSPSAMHRLSHLLLWRHFAFRSSRRSQPAAKQLTERQRQIVESVAAGLSDKQIARQLGLSQHTVRNVVRRLLLKYSLRKRIQLYALLAETSPTITFA